MNADELKKVLEDHLHWIKEDCEGWQKMRAVLRGADLRGANLYEADLRGANLCGANLYKADLRGANLCGANLYEANLCEANLYEADLREANLSGANLYGADLYEANIEDKLLNKFFPICCPEFGEFIGWKKAGSYIVKLRITEDAKRSSAFGRKCRCNKAVVLGIETMDGDDSGIIEVVSGYDKNFVYRVGETVEVPNFDTDRKNECAPGIHFFITRQEAVDY